MPIPYPRLAEAAPIPPRYRRASLVHELRALIGLACPVVLSRAGLLLMTTVDTVMTGWAGADQLAFLAIGLAPFVLLMLIGSGGLTGTAVLVAQAHGAGEEAATGRIWHHALLLAGMVGALACALLYYAEDFLLLAGQTPMIAQGGAHVAFMLGLGMPAMLGYIATTLFMEGLGRPRPGVIVILIGNIANVPLNHLLIGGGLGLAPMGAAGAVLATTIVRWAMLVGFMGYIMTLPELRRSGASARLRSSPAILGKLLRLGIPFAVSQGLETSAFQGLTLLCGWLGATALATYQIALNVTSLVYMATVGLGTATAIRVGRAIGAGDPGLALAAAWLGLAVTLSVMLTLAPALLVSAPWIAWLYTTDPTVTRLLLPCFALVAIVIVLDGAQGVLTGGLRGAADVWLPMLIHVASFWLVLLPTGYALAFWAGFGVRGLLGGIIAGLAMATTLLLWRLRSLAWHRIARV